MSFTKKGILIPLIIIMMTSALVMSQESENIGIDCAISVSAGDVLNDPGLVLNPSFSYTHSFNAISIGLSLESEVLPATDWAVSLEPSLTMGLTF